MKIILLLGDGIYTKCGNGQAWFGWKSGNGVGSISTTLTAASGRGQLSFGNCWDNGNVKVYLDGNEISAADPNTQKIVEFARVNIDSMLPPCSVKINVRNFLSAVAV